MKKQIRAFLVTFLITIPIAILVLKSFSSLEENILQVKFEEEKAIFPNQYPTLIPEHKRRYKNDWLSTESMLAKEDDCDFFDKYGSTFINWTGKIKYINEDSIVILSDKNGIEVQYKINDWVIGLDADRAHYEDITGNINDRTLNNENLDVGDDVYFSFHPVQSGSGEYECFEWNSYTEYEALKAPKYMVDIFKLSKNPWEITEEQITQITNKYNEEINIKIRIKEEEDRKRIAELERKLEKERIKNQQFEGSYYVGSSEDNCSFINFVFTSKGEYVVFTGNKRNNVKNCTAKGDYTYNQDDKSLNVSGFYNSNCYGTIEERNGIWKVKNNSIQAPNGVWFSKTSWSR